MWFSDVNGQLNRMMIPGRVNIKLSLEKSFTTYLKMLLSIMEQVKNEVHLGQFNAMIRWVPDCINNKTELFKKELNVQPFAGESVNWIEYYDGVAVCMLYLINNGIISVFPIFQLPKDNEWMPSFLYATVGNGKTFKQSLGEHIDNRDIRKTYGITDDHLDSNINIRMIGPEDSVDKKILDFHNRIINQAIFVLDLYGQFLSKDWVVMGDEVLVRSQRRHNNSTVLRKVLSVVENGKARMIGSFKCDKCNDSGFIKNFKKEDLEANFCNCEVGKELFKKIKQHDKSE